MAISAPAAIPLQPIPMPARRLYLSCADCRYGVALAGTVPARCPMCGGSTWVPEGRQPARPVA
jgi:hypothetical protein